MMRLALANHLLAIKSRQNAAWLKPRGTPPPHLSITLDVRNNIPLYGGLHARDQREIASRDAILRSMFGAIGNYFRSNGMDEEDRRRCILPRTVIPKLYGHLFDHHHHHQHPRWRAILKSYSLRPLQFAYIYMGSTMPNRHVYFKPKNKK